MLNTKRIMLATKMIDEYTSKLGNIMAPILPSPKSPMNVMISAKSVEFGIFSGWFFDVLNKKYPEIPCVNRLTSRGSIA